MITKEEFLKKYNISKELFKSADISWDDLCEIYRDFHEEKRENYEKILKDFVEKYLNGGADKTGIHSVHYRVKDPEHLLEKIIRKRQENSKKYRGLNKENYEKFITDLIGIRCLILFKSDWQIFHNFVLSKFQNNAEYYIKDSEKDFDDDNRHYYIAEAPKVHIRNGDSREIYEKLLPPDCVIDDKIYRSAHYIIKYEGVYLEIQVRTLFEEGWGEVDHAVVYPYYAKDPILKEYTELINRVVGLADEMGSFFNKLKELEIKYITYQTGQNEIETPQNRNIIHNNSIISDRLEEEVCEDNYGTATPRGCIQAVIKE